MISAHFQFFQRQGMGTPSLESINPFKEKSFVLTCSSLSHGAVVGRQPRMGSMMLTDASIFSEGMIISQGIPSSEALFSSTALSASNDGVS